MENRDFLLGGNENFSTGRSWKTPRLSTGDFLENAALTFTQIIFPHSTGPVEKILDGRGAQRRRKVPGFGLYFLLQGGIDIGRNVPDMVFQILVTGGHSSFYLVNGVQNGGVILAELLADVGGGKIGQFPDQIDGYLSGFHRSLAALGTTQGRFVDGVELAHLVDDQTGGGQGIALVLEHIVDGPGNVGQVHGHIV